MEIYALLVLGLVFMVLELFVVGGVLGLVGYALFAWSAYDLLGGGLMAAVWVGLLTLVVAIIAIVIITCFPQSFLGKHLTLYKRSTKEEGYISNKDQSALLGMRGTAHSVLRPAGIARIQGEFVDVVTEGEFIPAGTPIIVHKVSGARIVVRPIVE